MVKGEALMKRLTEVSLKRVCEDLDPVTSEGI